MSTRSAGTKLLRLQFEYLPHRVPEWRLEMTPPQQKSMQWPRGERGHENTAPIRLVGEGGRRKTHPRATRRRSLVVAPGAVGAPHLRRDLSLKVGRYQECQGTCHRHAGPVFSAVAQRRLQHAHTVVQHLRPFGNRRRCLGVFDARPVANRLSQLNSV